MFRRYHCEHAGGFWCPYDLCHFDVRFLSHLVIGHMVMGERILLLNSLLVCLP